MNTNNLGDLYLAKAEIEHRYGRRNLRRERPDSSLTVIARTMRRRRWEETHGAADR
ncbi:hypothetical protein [Intrasporangium sp.]|uniref:hypothetical protein n=1 Tax=Intrasporangium sp. TaxID=1925024 RepID=UPI0032221F20